MRSAKIVHVMLITPIHFVHLILISLHKQSVHLLPVRPVVKF